MAINSMRKNNTAPRINTRINNTNRALSRSIQEKGEDKINSPLFIKGWQAQPDGVFLARDRANKSLPAKGGTLPDSNLEDRHFTKGRIKSLFSRSLNRKKTRPSLLHLGSAGLPLFSLSLHNESGAAFYNTKGSFIDYSLSLQEGRGAGARVDCRLSSFCASLILPFLNALLPFLLLPLPSRGERGRGKGGLPFVVVLRFFTSPFFKRIASFTQIAALIFSFTLSPSFARADNGGGTVAVPFLKMDMGARYYGMAGAGTAFADDVAGMTFYNPAAIGRAQSLQISGGTYKNAVDMKHTYGALAFPVGFLSLFGNKPLSLGVSFYMFDKGDIEENNITRGIGDDISFALTYGENIATHTWDFMGNSSEVNHYLGASVKYVKSTLPLPLSGDVTGDAFAFDAGYQVVADNRFGAGVAIRNVGGKIKYIEESDPLPSTMSAGLFFTLVDYENMRWDLSGDVIYHIKERENRIRAGTEAVFLNILAVRGGIKFMEEIKEEFTLGFGLRLFGFEVDLGTVLNPQLNGDRVYQAGISYKFPLKKEENNYQKDEKKHSDYKEYKERQTREAQEKVDRNANPILYQ